MSPSNACNATLFVAAAIVAFANPASAFDFGNPADKRAYCQVYARQALNDVRAVEARGCSVSGISWSRDLNEQFNWCMAQGNVEAPTQESLTRSIAAEQCSAAQPAFPPVVGEASVQSASAESFPPVVTSQSADETTAFPPVVASEEASAASEGSGGSAASFPPVVKSSGGGNSSGSSHASQASFPPVVEEGPVMAEADAGDFTAADPFVDRSERLREVAERVIEFGREHEVEIRDAAQQVKEKIKQKLSDMKAQHDNDGDQVTDKLKAKIKQKLSSFKEQHGKQGDALAGKFKEKIKQKLTNLRERGGNGHRDENSLRSKVKGALKEGIMRRLANR